MNGRFVPEGIDWSHGAAVRADPRPVPAPLHPPLVGVGRRRRAGRCSPARSARSKARAPASIAIHSAFGTQILLGILTVLSGIAIWLAVLHQATGALLVAATVWGAHELGQARGMSVVSVYAVFANAEEAERIGRTVVEERLAACINILGPSARSTAGKARSRRPTKSPPSSRRPTMPADALITRIAGAAQLRRAVHRHLADRQGPRHLCRLGRRQRRLELWRLLEVQIGRIELGDAFEAAAIEDRQLAGSRIRQASRRRSSCSVRLAWTTVRPRHSDSSRCVSGSS